MNLLNRITTSESWLKEAARRRLRRHRLKKYLLSDRRPWSYGYDEYKAQFISQVLNDGATLDDFGRGAPLPAGYGYRLDERCIEIPWVLARIGPGGSRLLDAGSSLNHEFALDAPPLRDKKLTITTLAPEGVAYWQRGISYVYGDLRDLDFRDDWFDAVMCISTIEHVGMDNTLYSANPDIARPGARKDFVAAVREMKRVLKVGATLYITFPYGRYENHGFFQQFDAALMDMLIEAFAPNRLLECIFRYEPDGWRLSNRLDAAKCEYFNVHATKYFNSASTADYPSDYAAGVRAVACLELGK